MESGVATSAELASVPAGPALCARLSQLEAAAVEDEPLLALLSGEARQLAYQQARVWAVLTEIAHRDPMPAAVPRLSPEQVFDSAVDEIRAELLLTRRGAARELEHAATVCAQLRVFAALQRGELDRARAIVLASACRDLTGEQADQLLDRLLPEAATRTVTGLAERVRTIAVALDPAWAERRYRAAVRDRRVIGYLNEDGSATVSGQYLPAETAAAACDRVDALAAAAKRAGANAPIDHLRAELFLALLDGRYQHLTQPQIIAALCAHFPAATTTSSDDSDDAVRERDSRPADGPAAAAAAAAGKADEQLGGPGQPVLGATRGVELKVGLATLLGLDEQPGELAGWGPVTATLARRIAARQHRSEWRFAVLDDHGRLLSDGTTGHRPRPLRDPVQAEGGIVELHVPATLLDQPDLARDHPAWAKLLAHLTRQHAQAQPIEQDRAARFPGRRLRRRVQLINQRCVFAGCRRPATSCDQDHRHDYAEGGQTVEQNLEPACRHDHTNKTERGWRLVQLNPHTYCWISPLGRRHIVQVNPIAPALPTPIPRRSTRQTRQITLPDFDAPGPSYLGTIRRGRPVTPTKQPAPASDSDSDSEPPPF